jgi:hypothetical protein
MQPPRRNDLDRAEHRHTINAAGIAAPVPKSQKTYIKWTCRRRTQMVTASFSKGLLRNRERICRYRTSHDIPLSRNSGMPESEHI